jgi:epoxyqueuosine reductase
MHSRSVTGQFVQRCYDIGLDLAGVCSAEPPASYHRFCDWVEHGFHAGMDYLKRHCEARKQPDFVLAGTKSMIVVAISYPKTLAGTVVPEFSDCRIAKYAYGADYHQVLRDKMDNIARMHRNVFPSERFRIVVDTAPVLEREFAHRAGIGWFGKNTLLINNKLGSDFFLGILLSTAEISPTSPETEFSYCGNCRKCIDACPTGAIVSPYLLDSRKCLNYWTIEHKGEIPGEICRLMGNQLFGCDICQTVCPYNQTSRENHSLDPSCLNCQPYSKFPPDAAIHPVHFNENSQTASLTLEEMEKMNEKSFNELFGKTSLFRTGLESLKRNARIVRQNSQEKL